MQVGAKIGIGTKLPIWEKIVKTIKKYDKIYTLLVSFPSTSGFTCFFLSQVLLITLDESSAVIVERM